jgi:hypothetical protein
MVTFFEQLLPVVMWIDSTSACNSILDRRTTAWLLRIFGHRSMTRRWIMKLNYCRHLLLFKSSLSSWSTPKKKKKIVVLEQDKKSIAAATYSSTTTLLSSDA